MILAQEMKTIAPGIRRRGNAYEFNVSAGYDGAGKHIRKYMTYHVPEDVSEAKANKMAIEAFIKFSQIAKGNKSYGANMKFSRLCEIYFAEYAPNKLKKVTIENYKSSVRNHILPVFGNKKLKDISTSDISSFLTRLNCKPLTANKIKTVFHSILKFAVTQKYISENPCCGAVWRDNIEKDYGRIENVLNLTQAKKLISLLDEYSVFNTIIKLLLLTGMRSGECLGLRWSSIDFESKTIFIDKTLSYAGNKWFLSTPKTSRSTRTISIDDTTVCLLLRHREEQNRQKEIVGLAWQHPELVFTSYTGHWYDRSLLNAQFRRFIKAHKAELDLDHKITIHGLRHFHVSLLANEGINIQEIARRLGHANIEMTWNTYSHLYPREEERAIEILNKIV